MQKTTAIDRLVHHLLTEQSARPMVEEALIAAIADDPDAIAELTRLSTALRAEPSALPPAIRQIQENRTALAQLDRYVEADILGEAVAQVYPALHELIQHNRLVEQLYQQRMQAFAGEAETLFSDGSSDLSFAKWYGQQAQAAPASPAISAAESLWQQMQDGLTQLTTTIPIWLGEQAATFGMLIDALRPTQVPVGAFRSRHTAGDEETIALVEIPHTDANLTIKLWLGPVEDGVGTVILDLLESTLAQPLAETRITLRDSAGGLLESTA
ncbi:MAG: hypothetical protein KDE47_21525, partial [Caldilineaceae bacterium]|nr:hypothetical protein [Caldilineaceae bacterium]